MTGGRSTKKKKIIFPLQKLPSDRIIDAEVYPLVHHLPIELVADIMQNRAVSNVDVPRLHVNRLKICKNMKLTARLAVPVLYLLTSLVFGLQLADVPDRLQISHDAVVLYLLEPLTARDHRHYEVVEHLPVVSQLQHDLRLKRT